MLDLIIDGQCLQSDSRSRGIGRYTRYLIRAVCDARPNWRIRVVQVANLRPIPEADLCGRPVLTFSPPHQIRPFDVVGGRLNGLYYADWLAALRPDTILQPSVMEFQTVTPVFGSDRTARVVGVCYDFIPIMYADWFLSNPTVAAWYHSRVNCLLASDAILSISQATADDLHTLFPHWRGRSEVVYGAADAEFTPPTPSDADRLRAITERVALKPGFLLCVASSTDPHKNVSGAIRAYAALPPRVRQEHPLVVAGHLCGGQTELRRVVAELDLQDDVLFVGRVSESELIGLYQQCRLFICPSRYEGLGLPVLEALQCGAPVVTSTRSSLPEVGGAVSWLCDVESPAEFASALLAALAEPRDERREERFAHARRFSWPRTAEATCRAIERLTPQTRPRVAWFTPSADLLARYPHADLPAVWDALDAHTDIELVVERGAVGQWPNRKAISVSSYESNPTAYDLVVYTLCDDDGATFQLPPLMTTPGVCVLLCDTLDRLALRGLLTYPALYGPELASEPDGVTLLCRAAVGVVDLTPAGVRAADERGLAAVVGEHLAADVVARVADTVWLRRATAALTDGGGLVCEQMLARWADLRARRAGPRPPARPPRLGHTIWVDISTLLHHPNDTTGITRTVACLAHALARQVDTRVEFLHALPEGRGYVGLERADVLPLLRDRAAALASGVSPWHTDRRPAPEDVVLVPGLDLTHVDALRQSWSSAGCRTAFVLHDTLPFSIPHLFDSSPPGGLFNPLLSLAIQTAGLVFTVSESTRRDLFQFADAHGLIPPPAEHIRLGDSDLARVPPAAPAVAHALEVEGRPRFALLVSPIEVRKNHVLAYQAWRRLLLKHGPNAVPKLVFAGDVGWMAGDLITQLAHDPVTRNHTHILSGTSDGELAWLYTNCLFTLFPSLYEGWGLPVAEGLAFGKMCLASDSSSLPEIAGDLVDYHDPQDLPAYVTLLERAIFDADYRAERERQIAARFRGTAWADTAAQIVAAVDAHFGPVDPVIAAEPAFGEVRHPRTAMSAA